MTPVYPSTIDQMDKEPDHAGQPASFDCSGGEVSLTCGVMIRFFLTVGETGEIEELRYESNACGWAIAAAEVLARGLEGADLRELHNLEDVKDLIGAETFETSGSRANCLDLAIEALRKTLANFRESQVTEWKGEQALICSCFGVDESTIENLVTSGAANSVSAVGDECNAGTGCGSCRMLIEDIIESERKRGSLSPP